MGDRPAETVNLERMKLTFGNGSLRTCIAALACLALTACGGLFDTAAAVVYGEKISEDAVQQELEEFRATDRYSQLAGQGDIDAVERQFVQGILAGMVRTAVLEPAAADRGIEVTQEDVTAELDLIKADFPDDTAFQEALKEQALTEETLTDLIANRLLEDRLREEVVGELGVEELEVRTYYTNHIEDYSETCVQHILVNEEAEARLIAADLQRAKPQAIDGLFVELAAKHSKDTSNADQGGELGCNPAGQFVAEFEDAMNALEIGEISDPVRSEFGFHIIKVNERKVVPFEEVQTQLTEQLSGPRQDEAWEEFITELYDEAEVRINPRYGVLDVATGQILDPDARQVPAGEAPQVTEPTTGPQLDVPQP